MASNPVVVPCTLNEWVIVATAVIAGRVYRISDAPSNYAQTIRLTGEAVPADDTDAVPLFDAANSEPIASDAAIDVYVKAYGKAGSVRVDL